MNFKHKNILLVAEKTNQRLRLTIEGGIEVTNINGYYEFGDREQDALIVYDKILKSNPKIENENLLSAIVSYNTSIAKSVATVLLTDKSLYYFKGLNYKEISLEKLQHFDFNADKKEFSYKNGIIKITTTSSRTSIYEMGLKISSILKIEKNDIIEKPDVFKSKENNAANMQHKEVVKCKKCGCTSVTTTNKKLSIGRGIVGTALFSPLGGAVGALTSKKLYCVCMNCGHKWKL